MLEGDFRAIKDLYFESGKLELTREDLEAVQRVYWALSALEANPDDYRRLVGTAQARAGQPTLIANYLGKGDKFDEAVADFATAYAEQNERDYKALVRAAQQNRIEVYTKS